MSTAFMDGDARWISEQDVAETITLPDAITALREALTAEAAGGVHQMTKTHTAWDGATLHAIGAAAPSLGIAVTKTWAHTAGGANPLLAVFDSGDGRLRAVIEAFALGQLRTAAISGVATDLLAAPGASELALFGTGRQALGQAAAVCAVRPILNVRVWGRNRGRADALAARVREELDVEAVAMPDVAQAAGGAAVLTLVTRATEPFLTERMPAEGAHLNAVGAITPERTEFEPALLRRCSTVTVDSVSAVKALSAEMRAFYGPSDNRAWEAVRPLAEMVAKKPTRSDSDDLTLFKAMGTGLADLALAATCLARLPAQAGRPIPPSERHAPRWRHRTQEKP